MPWDSRISSESRRRLVIALIMFVLLLLSSGVAAWLSASRSPTRTLGAVERVEHATLRAERAVDGMEAGVARVRVDAVGRWRIWS